VKREDLLPTGSFKARGAAVMVALARDLHVESMVVDSSGNAGVAAAAYAQAASIHTEVYVPVGTDPAKVEAVRRFGAEVRVVGHDRQATAEAARRRVESSGAWYASHAHQPAFHHGVKTLAYELAGGPGAPPSTVVVAAGNGTLVIGLWIGFRELLRLGRLSAAPRIVAVQSANCAPLAGLHPRGPTVAGGIAIARPARFGQIRAALSASRGGVVTVSEDQIGRAVIELSERGMEASPTGSVAWAGWTQAADHGPRADGPVVVVLSGR
jgi:threonine synthase